MLRRLMNVVIAAALAGAVLLGYQMWRESRPAVDRGRSALSDGEYDTAASWLEAARVEDPDDMSILLDLGDAYQKMGDKPRAAAAFRGAEPLLYDPGQALALERYRREFQSLRSEGY